MFLLLVYTDIDKMITIQITSMCPLVKVQVRGAMVMFAFGQEKNSADSASWPTLPRGADRVT